MKTKQGTIYPMTEPPATSYVKAMQVEILRLRWITGQCVQIRLPDDKVLMIDPIFPHSPCWKDHLGTEVEDFTQSMIGKVDYILITHSHCDHMDGIPEVLSGNKQAVVLCNEIYASQASVVYNIPCGSMRPFLNGQHYNYGSFALDTFQSTHVDLGVTADPADMMQFMKPEWAYGPKGAWERLNGFYGTLHGTSFLITLPNGYRIGYATGTCIHDLARDERWRKNLPNLLLRHKVYDTPERKFAEEIASLGGQIAMPVDFEAWLEKTNDVNGFANQVNHVLMDNNIRARLIVPQRYQWYSVSADAALFEVSVKRHI